MNISEIQNAEFTQFVQDHLREDPALLLFKYQGKVSFDLKSAVQQISARQKAVKKLPEWVADSRLIFPPALSLEQCSSEETAKFKATELKGSQFLDLTGGFGVDSFYLGDKFTHATYCEQSGELAEIAKHNLNLLAPGKFQVVSGDGLDFLQKSESVYDLIYADPARRGVGNQKLYKLQDCQPDVVNAWNLLKSKSSQILLKLSPMLDISQALSELPEIQKVTVLSVKNEVREVLLHWQKEEINPKRTIRITDLGSGFPSFEFSQEAEDNAESTFGEVEKYLVEPLSGVLKAGAFKLFGSTFGLKKLEKNSHLYTSQKLPSELPGRIFEVIQEVTTKKQEIKTLFPTGKANVLCRNYALSAEDLKKKLGLKDGGEDYLIGTKSARGFQILLCKRLR